jgi:hypothetical protein
MVCAAVLIFLFLLRAVQAAGRECASWSSPDGAARAHQQDGGTRQLALRQQQVSSADLLVLCYSMLLDSDWKQQMPCFLRVNESELLPSACA